MSTDPCGRIADAALACLEEAFLLCVPEPGDQICVVDVAKRMRLEDNLGVNPGQACAHAISVRLQSSGRISPATRDSSGKYRVTRL